MLSLTDIPDWIITEGFGKYDFDFKVFGKKKESNDLYEKSPISHIDKVFHFYFKFSNTISYLRIKKVKTPTLLMIGNVDLRVPPSQGVEYHKALLARNVPSK
jgi:acylaminoacyl-peptidase